MTQRFQTFYINYSLALSMNIVSSFNNKLTDTHTHTIIMEYFSTVVYTIFSDNINCFSFYNEILQWITEHHRQQNISSVSSYILINLTIILLPLIKLETSTEKYIRYCHSNQIIVRIFISFLIVKINFLLRLCTWKHTPNLCCYAHAHIPAPTHTWMHTYMNTHTSISIMNTHMQLYTTCGTQHLYFKHWNSVNIYRCKSNNINNTCIILLYFGILDIITIKNVFNYYLNKLIYIKSNCQLLCWSPY